MVMTDGDDKDKEIGVIDYRVFVFVRITKWDGEWSVLNAAGEKYPGLAHHVAVLLWRSMPQSHHITSQHITSRHITPRHITPHTTPSHHSLAHHITSSSPSSSLQSEGKLFIGGRFRSTADGTSQLHRVAVWDGTSYHQLGNGTDNLVSCMDISEGNGDGDGDVLFVGGAFTHAGSGKASKVF